jgi:hypothetical protein
LIGPTLAVPERDHAVISKKYFSLFALGAIGNASQYYDPFQGYIRLLYDSEKIMHLFPRDEYFGSPYGARQF